MAASTSHDSSALLRQALQAIDGLRAQVRSLEGAHDEPVAITGLACRFPGAPDADAFWQLLAEGRSGITEVPATRWDLEQVYDPDPLKPGKTYARHGGFLSGIDRFDAEFFGISPREAVSMDPQQRLLLELTWHALEDAAIVPGDLFGQSVGVFLALSSTDYPAVLRREVGELGLDAYAVTGSAFSVASGRISYLLGLQGPSLVVDTACSSSLVALHVAAQSLRRRECELAIVGASNMMLTPDLNIMFSKARMLSRAGRCATFDAAADGYVRGEGAAVVVLRRWQQAQEAGDPVRCILRGSAINQDGKSGGLTVPNGVAQQGVIREALRRARIDPVAVQYVEAHGTGTSLGDPVEIGALQAVYGAGRPREQPLKVGSVKTNVGHLEAASGMAGLIKLCLALEQGEIPAQLHFHNPSPHIDWRRAPIEVSARHEPWPVADSRLGAVSSFGFSGTNAHVVVEGVAPTPQAEEPRSLRLLPLSARTHEGLRELAASWQRLLRSELRASIDDLVHTATTGRTLTFDHRLAVVGESAGELADGLEGWLQGALAPRVVSGVAGGPAVPPSQLASPLHAGEHSAAALRGVAAAYVGGAAVDWRAFARSLPGRRCPRVPGYPFQRSVFWAESRHAGTETDPPSTAASYGTVLPTPGAAIGAAVHEIRSAPPQVRPGLVALYLRAQLSGLLRVAPDSIPLNAEVASLGLDSLMIMDVLDRLKTDFGLVLFPREAYQHATLDSLAAYISRQFDPAAAADAVSIQPAPEVRTTLSMTPSRSAAPSPSATSIDTVPGVVVLLSAPRSGSTLLRVMLAGHSQLFAPPELHLLPFADLAERRRELARSHLGEGLQRAMMDLFQLDAEASRELLDRWADEGLSTTEVYRRLHAAIAPRLLVDKSPSYALSCETLAHAERCLSQARYVHLVRHPRAVIESAVRMRMERLWGVASVDPQAFAESIWQTANRNTEEFFTTIEERRRHILRYEDLVADPEREMRRLCTFLEVGFEPALLEPYRGSRMADGVTAKSLPIGDVNFGSHSQIDKGLAEGWRDRAANVPLEPRTARLSRRWDYDPGAVSAAIGCDWTEETVTARGLSFRVCWWGDRTRPVVLLLHGVLDQAAVWAESAELLLRAGYCVLAPDLRGHGLSDHSADGSGYRLMEFVGDVAAILDRLDVVPAVVAGHSLGAVIALLLCSARQLTSARLVLIEPPGSPGEPRALSDVLAAQLSEPAHARHEVLPDLQAAAARLREAYPSLSAELADRLAERGTRNAGDGVEWRFSPRLRDRRDFVLDEVLLQGIAGRLVEPWLESALLVVGTRGQRGWHDFWKNAGGRCVTLAGTHALHIDAAHEIAQLIADSQFAGAPPGLEA